MKWLGLFGLCSVFFMPSVLAQIRRMPHLTTSESFQTQIWLHNTGTESEQIQLVGMTDGGLELLTFQTSLDPGMTQVLSPDAVLGAAAAYVQIQAATSVRIAARYRSSKTNSGWAHVADSRESSKAWQFFGGNPSQTWDGFAVINLGGEPTTILLHQWDFSGEEVAVAVVQEMLNPSAKALFVLSDFLQPQASAVYRVTADQPLALIGIRGNHERDFLWENPSKPVTRTIGETPFRLTQAFPGLQFNQPVDLQTPDDDSNRIFVVEQRGVIRVFENDPQVAVTTTFLDISSAVTSGGEMGLLGLTFHPNFSDNGRFWVNYTTTISGPRRTLLARFQVDALDLNRADPQSSTVVLEVIQPRSNHNGGQLAFGADNYLYMSLGDSGGAGDPDGVAQNPSSLLGSILRLDVPIIGQGYQIPPDNPFVGNTQGWREEIFAYGFRNPWRFSFDHGIQGGRLWVADVGQNRFEEINIVTAGGNYGWNRLEGNACFPSGNLCDRNGLVPPIFAYSHDRGDQSITGGFVYRGTVFPELVGAYIYADFWSGRVWALRYGENLPVRQWLLTTFLPQHLVSFGSDQAGELFLCSFDGRIYRLAYLTDVNRKSNGVVER